MPPCPVFKLTVTGAVAIARFGSFATKDVAQVSVRIYSSASRLLVNGFCPVNVPHVVTQVERRSISTGRVRSSAALDFAPIEGSRRWSLTGVIHGGTSLRSPLLPLSYPGTWLDFIRVVVALTDVLLLKLYLRGSSPFVDVRARVCARSLTTAQIAPLSTHLVHHRHATSRVLSWRRRVHRSTKMRRTLTLRQTKMCHCRRCELVRSIHAWWEGNLAVSLTSHLIL